VELDGFWVSLLAPAAQTHLRRCSLHAFLAWHLHRTHDFRQYTHPYLRLMQRTPTIPYGRGTLDHRRTNLVRKSTQMCGAPLLCRVWGAADIIITVTDNYTRYTCIALLRAKDEALKAYEDFAAWNEKQHGYMGRVKHFRSDRGGQFTRAEFKKIP